MASRQSGIIWFLTSVGGAVPLVFSLLHIVHGDAFGAEDLLLWPSSLLLIGKHLSTLDDAGLFVLAYFANIVWYMGVGWVVAKLIDLMWR